MLSECSLRSPKRDRCSPFLAPPCQFCCVESPSLPWTRRFLSPRGSHPRCPVQSGLCSPLLLHARHSSCSILLHWASWTPILKGQVLSLCGGLVAKSSPTLATPWTVACKAPLSMGFSRQEYWSGLPFPLPGHLPDSGIEPRSPALQADSLPTELLAGWWVWLFLKPSYVN